MSTVFESLGSLFDTNVRQSEQILQCAIQIANNEKLAGSNIKLGPRTFEISYGNELAASKSVCKLLKVSFEQTYHTLRRVLSSDPNIWIN